MLPIRIAGGVAACVFLGVLVVGHAQQAISANDQRLIAEQAIAKMSPMMQPIARAKLNEALAARAAEEKAAKDKASQPAPAASGETPATPADLDYNRKQWEPMLRKAHAAQKAFDDFVDDQLKANCPKEHEISRSGSGYIYELPTLSNSWVRASNSADLDVQVLGESYPPKDGRYDFDFSQVRLGFDQKKAGDVIASACAELKQKLAPKFYAGVDPLIAAKDWDGVYKFEQKAHLWVDPLNKRLDDVIQEQNPAPTLAWTLAMINGKRIK